MEYDGGVLVGGREDLHEEPIKSVHEADDVLERYKEFGWEGRRIADLG